MRVMCIETPSNPNPKTTAKGKLPIVRSGDTYHVIGSGPADPNLESWYELAEHRGFAYAKRLFIPLQSDTAPEIEIEQPQPTHA